jgi:integrase/recombinase XerD
LDYELISFGKEVDKKISALDWEGMKQLLLFMKNDQSKSEVIRIRDYAMALMLIYTWLRVSELINLKIEDIQENIQVIGKWGKRRLVCLDEEYIKVVKLYLFLRKNIKSEYVFVSHSPNSYWNRISRNSVENIIREAGEKAGVGKIRPHKLRHTCATQMLENWGNIVYISQILWHKNLRTTQGYLDYSNDKLRETQNLIPRVE